MPLAANVRRLRLAAELSCRELDRRAGLGEGHVALIESGARADPQVSTLKAVAGALGVTLTQLTD